MSFRLIFNLKSKLRFLYNLNLSEECHDHHLERHYVNIKTLEHQYKRIVSGIEHNTVIKRKERSKVEDLQSNGNSHAFTRQ